MRHTFTLLFILVLGLPFFASAQTSTFVYTGSAQTYTVPSGVTSVTVDARGARGGTGYMSYSRGGYGGRVVCSLAVTPGAVLNVYVGGTGGSAISCCGVGAAGYNGGGLGSIYAGGGGGASDIRMGGTAVTDRVIVAGGGGGGGYWNTTPNWERGGDGGGTTGEAGFIYNMHSYTWGFGLLAAAGAGGTSSAGGAGGYWGSISIPGSPGSLGSGGAGYTGGFAGGGGGGYYGGGGGTELSGGGGGSSYTDASLTTSVSHTQGYNTNNDTVFITVNCSAGVITGNTSLCLGASSTLADTAGGGSGTWSSSTTSVATIGSTTGVVNSVSAGTTTITYTVSVWCGTVSAYTTVTVNPLPAIITGTTNVCVGSTTTLSSTSSGGSWSSGSTGVATIGSSTGIVTGVASGTSLITYTLPTGCSTTATVTVNPLPANITGSTALCEGSTITLSDATSGGTWISGTTGVATIGSTTGVLTGIAGGTSVITYRLSATGCIKTSTITVNPLPGGITGFSNLCAGTSVTYSSSTGGGTWTSSNTTVASVGSTTGLVTANAAGTAVISYSLPTGCFTTTTVTVFPLPAPITGTTSVCEGATTTLSDATGGGTWASSDMSVATIDVTTGVVTGVATGTSIITYQLITGCFTTTTVTVNSMPSAISGTTTLCMGSSTTLFSSGGGTWSSSATGVATIGSTSGIVFGIGAGTSVISYTLPTGCAVTTTVTVNPPPAGITGTLSACIGATSLLADATSGGTWISGSSGIASIGSTTGLVTGVSTGTTIITYRLSSTGCTALASFTVSPSPAAIVGASAVCVGSAITLTDATSGGTWSSSNTAVGTIGASTGILTGITSGTTVISYTIGTGCFRTTTITVNPLPAAITGSTGVCVSLTLTLTDASAGGTWSSGSTGIATVGSTTGIVTGVTGGTAVITYTLPTGCRTTTTITVGSSPGTITGTTGVCIGSSATLSIGTTGGTWSSASTAIATIGSTSGVASGVSAGTTTITYSMGGSCRSTTSFTVYPSPASIGGPASICLGSSVTLTDATTGGTWSSSNANVTIGSATGVAMGAAVGTSIITYTSAQGCTITRTESVNPLPAAITGPTAVCVGSTITLSDASTGGTWSSGSTGIATIGSLSGIVTGLATGSAVITYTLPGACITTTTVTVNLAPGAITGPGLVCVGNTITLGNSVSGGIWTSSNPAVASVGSLSGVVTGVGMGLATISYSLGAGCIVTKAVTVDPAVTGLPPTTHTCVGGLWFTTLTGGTWSSSSSTIVSIGSASSAATALSVGVAVITFTRSPGCIATMTFSVDPTPTAISGLSTVCTGSSTTLSNSVSGGVWTSSNPAVASVGSTTGIVAGNAPGVVTITYAIGICEAYKTVTVSPGATISGSSVVCTGLSITLTPSVSGGTWSDPAYTSIATVGASSGIVNGLTPGTAVITYTSPSGCVSTKTVNVNTMPGAITGLSSICIGSSTTLSNSTAGGTWYSTSALVTVGSTSGVVTGVAAGVAGITYSLGSGCVATTVMTVLPAGPVISGSSSACDGGSIYLTASGSGTWTSSSTAIATVSSTGIVSGVSTGTAVITFTPTAGCPTTKSVTFNPLPAPSLGIATVCQGSTTLFTNSGGGTWSCSPTSVASIGSATGLLTGVAPGTVTVTYMLPTGCWTAISPVTVTPRPSAITGAPAICVGATTTMYDSTSGGVWSSGDPSVATIGSSSGIVTGIASGTVALSYTLGTSGCSIPRTIIVNPISPVLGTDSVCVGQNISLYDTSLGGTWTSSSTAVATATTASGGMGVIHGVSAGTVTITYTLPTGCFATRSVRVLAAPPAITGTRNVCVGQVTLLYNSISGGVWSSDHASVATVGASSGAVAGITAGTATISYSVSGCPATATVTVNPLPGAISGSPNICVGTTTTLSDAGGGTWTSSAASIATVGLYSGIVTGILPGTATITYTLPTGCSATLDITINPSPAPITGSTNICVTNTTTLYDATFGGTWSSSSTSIAPVDAFGTVSGLAVGSATITYTAPTSCIATTTVMVNSLPSAITGSANVCEGSTITLTDASSGGSWSSSAATADVGSLSGIVTGITAGPATITYSLGAGCIAMKDIVVNPLPAAITGTTNVCAGHNTYLYNTTGGGSWSSSPATVATIDASGTVSGVSAGTAIISYTLPTSCAVTTSLVVNPSPGPIGGPTNICLGSTALMTDSVAGATWTSTNTSVATIGSATGIATGLSIGSATVICSTGMGCTVSKNIYVVPLPGTYTVTGGGNFCAGGTGVHVGLTGSAVGVNYLLYNGSSVATGPIAGTGSALDFGLQTVAGMYTVVAVSTSTLCSRRMTGTALIVVNPSVAPSVDITTGIGDTLCAGTLATFTPLPTNGGSSPVYVWNINGTDVATSGTYSYTPANGDLVKVTMTSNANCAIPATASHTKTMTVWAQQLPVVNVLLSPKDTVCQGQAATFTAIPDYGGATPSFMWTVNGGMAATGGTYTYAPANGDQVAVTLTSSYPCRLATTANSNPVTMSVVDPLLPQVRITANPGLNINRGQWDTLHAELLNAVTAPTYQWFKNGMPIAGATTNTYFSNEFNYPQSDSFTCQVTDHSICTMTGFGWSYVTVGTVGVQPVAQGGSSLSVLPNPNKGEFTIKGSLNVTDEQVTLELTDMLGQVVHKEQVRISNSRIDHNIHVSNIANGMYLLTVRTDKENAVFHVVIEQ